MNRRAIRDLAAKELGLRTAKYFYAKTYDEFKRAADEIGFPCVVKPLMSSSGHGQSYVHNDDELEQAFREAMEGSRGDVKEVIIEEFIDFESEFTLLTVTQKNGWPTLFCPPIGHVQKGGDYRESWQPYQISEEALKQAQHMADQVTKSLTGAGIWGVEFFLTKQGRSSSQNCRLVPTIRAWSHLLTLPTSVSSNCISVPSWVYLFLRFTWSMLELRQLYCRLLRLTRLLTVRCCHTI